jgi:hypothetical protein
MRIHFRRIALTLPVVLLVWLSGALPVEAAAPRLILVYGPPLAQPVVLDDWQENLTLMVAAAEDAGLSADKLRGRPYFRLAFFWGPEWTAYVDAGKPLSALRPEQGNQAGRFYPAVGDAGPVLTFDSIPGPGPLTRRLEPAGVAVLARHGIPTRYSASQTHSFHIEVLLPLLATLVLVTVAILVIRTSLRRNGGARRQ